MRKKENKLDYSLVIEGTSDPHFFCYYSPNLVGFTGAGKSIEDCLRKVKLEIEEHLQVLKEEGFPIPPRPIRPRIITKGVSEKTSTTRNEIHVLPTSKGDWNVVTIDLGKKPGFHTKKEALNHARSIIESSNGGVVIVHGKDKFIKPRKSLRAKTNQ